MFKHWIKQFLAAVVCLMIILSSFNLAYAKDYVKNDDDEETDSSYYIIDGEDVDDLFDFGIWDVDNLATWIFDFKTYTVIKQYEDEDGDDVYKMYFNTPNLQSIVKNRVISSINDGYTDDTYNIYDNEWVVPVGDNASSENVITKYGFNVPCYTYMGEYPKEVMSTAGILPSPKKWYQVLWRAIKSLFGASFIKAPDADNFNTISYLNHTYSDKNDYIIDFFKLYYLDYFERQIPVDHVYTDGEEKDYFEGPEHVIELAVTEDANSRAFLYNKLHEDEYKEACQRQMFWETYTTDGLSAALDIQVLVGDRQYDPYHLFASSIKYRTEFNKWIDANTSDAYILCEAALANGPTTGHKRYTSDDIYWSNSWSGINMTSTRLYGFTNNAGLIDYAENAEYESSISLAADIMKYAADSPKLIAHYHYTEETGSRSSTSDSWSTDTNTYYEDTEFYNTSHWRDDDQYHTSHYASNGLSYTKTSNYKIDYLYIEGDSSRTMEYSSYKDFMNTCSFSNFEWEESDVYPSSLHAIYDAYTANSELMDNYDKFCKMLDEGDDQDSATSKPEILYRQCMITNEGEDEECWSRKYGDDKTSLSIVQVYAYSRIWQVTEDYDDDEHELTTQDAYAILSRIQSYCGPYSNEVIGNMMKLMCATANYEGDDEPMNFIVSDDLRVMPYDTATLTKSDRKNYDVTDPRTELYKSHIIGQLVADFKLNPLAIGIFFKPQKSIISLAGKITEFSVFFQQICNFELLDSFGLSPTTLWTNGYVAFLLAMLALLFIVKTVLAIFKMGNGSTAKLIASFLIFACELGIITAISVNPERAWSVIKNADTKIMNLGEMGTVYSTSGLEYLYGDASDMEVTYYMPYLDIWSKYNTGYGIMDNEQKIDTSKNLPELAEIDLPKIGSNEIQHWSVLLMDAFSYYGESTHFSNTINIDGNICNGTNINSNAYRVVDHFMAPRVDIEEDGDNLEIELTQNENYNGEFQTGVIDVLVKLLNCILCCLLSLIKMLTFCWQWFMLYIFIFRVVIGKSAEGKTTARILIETFSPTLAIIFLGMYTGIVMTMGMTTEGLLGILIEVFLFWLTFRLIKWWHDLRNQMYFPKTLVWLYFITNLSVSKHRRNTEVVQNQARLDDIESEMDEDYSTMTVEQKREVLFDENGNRRPQYMDKKYDKQVYNWYMQTKALQQPDYNVLHSNDTLRLLNKLEQDEEFQEICRNMEISKSTTAQVKQISKNQLDLNADVKHYTASKRLRIPKIGSSKNTKSTNNTDAVDNMYNDKK